MYTYKCVCIETDPCLFVYRKCYFSAPESTQSISNTESRTKENTCFLSVTSACKMQSLLGPLKIA